MGNLQSSSSGPYMRRRYPPQDYPRPNVYPPGPGPPYPPIDAPPNMRDDGYPNTSPRYGLGVQGYQRDPQQGYIPPQGYPPQGYYPQEYPPQAYYPDYPPKGNHPDYPPKGNYPDYSPKENYPDYSPRGNYARYPPPGVQGYPPRYLESAQTTNMVDNAFCTSCIAFIACLLCSCCQGLLGMPEERGYSPNDDLD